MTTPIYLVAKQSAQVLALLGGPEPRFYPFGQAPAQVAYPYAVYQVVAGQPENFLANRPDMDGVTVQVDVYGQTEASAVAVAGALRHALELDCHITALRLQGRDAETHAWRVTFDTDWFVDR